jgi:hypothetical protein
VFITNVPFAWALEPPKVDQLRPFNTVLPSPQVSVSSLGRLAAVLQLVIFSGEAAEAEIAPKTTIAATSVALARRSLYRRIK